MFRFIDDQQEYSVTKWAKFLGISRSGYYEWKKGEDSRNQEETEYRQKIKEIFEESDKTYGVDRICGAMRKQGYKASAGKVKRIMAQSGLKSIHNRRRQKSLTDSRKSRGDEYLNLVKGKEIERPLQVITSDISYIRTGEGFAYLCKIRDVKSGVVLSESVADNMKSELVVKTVKKLLQRWTLPSDCIFHSDRGSQYTSENVKNLLITKGISQSFSRVGKPGDNSWSESFFANLKKEAVHWKHFQTIEEAKEKMFAYINGFYNTKRIQKRLGYLSPMEWLKRYWDSDLKCVA